MSKSTTGYEVRYVLLHSQFEKCVYWSMDLDDARGYGRMVVRDHGHNHGVYIANAGDDTVCEWVVQGDPEVPHLVF